MKNFIALFICTFLVGSTFAIYKTSPPVSEEVAKKVVLKDNLQFIQWDKTTHEFGTIEYNIPAITNFVLTNKHNEPLVLERVKGSCGCTVADYDRNPIAPGESTTIKVTFNAKQDGQFNKKIMVQTNFGEEPAILNVIGNVNKEEETRS